MYRYELHIHTAENDLAAHVPAAEIVRMYKNAGYDGIVITDHYFPLFFDWFHAELDGAAHTQIIDRWLRGYRAAKEEGDKIGFTVLPGAEVRFQDSINDYLVYGVDETFFYNAPLLCFLRGGLHELLPLLPKEACVVWAHPFRDGMTVIDPTPLFGIEGQNGGTDAYRNQMAQQFAAHYGKPITSGSDFHHSTALARGGIRTETPIRTPKDLTDILRSGAYSLIFPDETSK